MFMLDSKCYFCVNSQDWGYQVKYKKIVVLPNMAIKSFALQVTPDERMIVKKWKDVPFTVEDFSFEEYCQEFLGDFLD